VDDARSSDWGFEEKIIVTFSKDATKMDASHWKFLENSEFLSDWSPSFGTAILLLPSSKE
jgi:hypothetical protein